MALLRAGIVDWRPPSAWVLIGSENRDDALKEISVVASPYRVGDKQVGVLGVLGPRRMPYSRLTAIVDYTADLVSPGAHEVGRLIRWVEPAPGQGHGGRLND